MVLLDTFHAVQRITSKIQKRHPYHHECLKSLQLVFRDPSDQGTVRTKVTLPADVLRSNFKEMWENVEYHGIILPPAAIKEIIGSHGSLWHTSRQGNKSQ